MSVEIRPIKGGKAAHVGRRFFHLAMFAVPFLYYYFLIQHTSEKILHLSILAFIFFVFLFEKFRIRMRLVLFGQRLHEATQLSTFAWTMLSLGIILFFAPVEMAVPIIATCAFVDPLNGEMRLHSVPKKIIAVAGIFVAILIWLICAWIYHFPLWYSIIIAPVSVAVEWPTLKWIDDNALMLLVPLVITLLLRCA